MPEEWYLFLKQNIFLISNDTVLTLRLEFTQVDRQFFQRQAGPKISICTMATLITFYRIDANQYITDEYAIILFIFESMQKNQLVLAKFWQEVHLVNNLKANILISIDIMRPELVVVDMGQKRDILRSCNMEVFIEIKFLLQSAHGVKRPIHTQKTTVVPQHSVLPICIHHLYQVPKDPDSLSEP